MRLAVKRHISFILVCLFFFNTSLLFAQRNVRFAAQTSSIERKIDSLLAKMTLAEKLGQLQQLDGEASGKYRPEHLELARNGLLGSTLNVRGAEQSNELQKIAVEQSRLKIPMLFAFDVIHGYRTMFPIPLGESASWDLASIEKSAHIAATEARSAGVHWTFAPMVDIARDPRWGRIAEGAGEDTFLGSQIAFARVRGFQGTDFSQSDRVMACAKHFAAYGAAEAGRDYNTTDMSERTLREIYFPPFKAAVDAGVGSFMTSFNSISGVPSTANPFLWKQILRDEWKSDALVVTDYTAVMELMKHGVALDEADAARLALNAGIDIEMVSRFVNKHGEQLVQNKKLSMATIDNAVREVLRTKFKLGLFEKPYADANRERAMLLNAEHRKFARQSANESFVLLKNERETLPIKKSIKEIAVVGFLAGDQRNMNGNWAGDGREQDAVTVFEGVKNKLGNSAKVKFASGCDAKCEDASGFDEAVKLAQNSDFTILTVGEDIDMSAEASSRTDIGLPGKQLELVKRIHQTGKSYAVVLMNGRPLTINWLAENSPAILETWFAGTEAGNAIADTLFGDANPSGKLPITFPRSVGQIPIYYNALPTGRPFEAENKYTSKYLDSPNTPLYPFGYGLSYTTFKVSNLQLSQSKISKTGELKVSVDVENTGKRAGAEVVQVYVRDFVASLSRPVKELKAFQRVSLKAGEKRKIELVLKAKDLGFYNTANQYVVEAGEFGLTVGTSSNDDGLKDTFTIVK
ncbi:MAG: glycoside hydrolase family 3 C-terminal domain-containing protein [Acidobacteria bacterium]|jgi:beta-glucosidase|nr:glycoside hydrolase family 3 C-terminal domain-containing protein [Acidobacteriota bacterium]